VVRIHVLYRDSGTREKRFKGQSTWSSLRGCRSSFHSQPRKTYFTIGKFKWGFLWVVEAGLECLVEVIFCCLALVPPFSVRFCQSQTHEKCAKRHVMCMYKPFQRSVPIILCGLSLICPQSFPIATFHHSISVYLTFLRLNVRLFWMFEHTTYLQIRCFEVRDSWVIMLPWFAKIWFLEFTKTLRFANFLDTTQGIVVIPYRLFGAVFLSHLQEPINARRK